MQAVLAKYEADGKFRTFRENQRPYAFRGFFQSHRRAVFSKNSFAIITKDFVDSSGAAHRAGTVLFQGPDRAIRYYIDIDEFLDKFDVGESNFARRKPEKRRAVRVGMDMLRDLVDAGAGTMAPSGRAVVLSDPSIIRRISLGDFVVVGSSPDRYSRVDSAVFSAIYIEDERNIRAARRRKTAEKSKAMPPAPPGPGPRYFPFGMAGGGRPITVG